MINDDAFAKMVSEDVKRKISYSDKNVLMQSENWDRWKDTLLIFPKALTISRHSQFFVVYVLGIKLFINQTLNTTLIVS